MDDYRRLHDACGLGAKAHQNLTASLEAFERFIAHGETDDHVLRSSLFHTAVIRYAKPFTATKSSNGLMVRYPDRHLKRVEGFDDALHNHLIEIRNTLIAHDDFEQIKPRLHFGGITVTIDEEELFVPMTVNIINKCLMHPADLDTVTAMARHVEMTLEGVVRKLREELERLRQLIMDDPEKIREFHTEKLRSEKFKIPEDGLAVALPDVSGVPGFAPEAPDFAEVHSGFQYETGKMKMTFPEASIVKTKS